MLRNCLRRSTNNMAQRMISREHSIRLEIYGALRKQTEISAIAPRSSRYKPQTENHFLQKTKVKLTENLNNKRLNSSVHLKERMTLRALQAVIRVFCNRFMG